MKIFKIVVGMVLCVACVFCSSCVQGGSDTGFDNTSARPPETPSFDTVEIPDYGELFSKHTYVVTYTRELTYNNSVGNEWEKGVRYDGEYISSSSKIIVDASLTEIALEAFATELDQWDDYGSTSVTFDALDVGQEQTKWATVIVVENEGRFKGNRAEWYFEITIKRIS